MPRFRTQTLFAIGIRALATVAGASTLVGAQTTVPSSSPASAPATATERTRAVDELFRPWHAPDSPGAAVLVIERGQVVHARGYGMADLEQGIPIRPDTVFDVASVSKQFAAMAIALLEADGRLSLDDDVRQYVPELADFGHRITIRHLVHHTSGFRDWPGTLAMGGWSYEDVVSFDQILRMAFRQRELNFVPGSAYAYSNTGYNLLAEIVKRISGQSFAAFTDARIFRPLGMRRTHFHDDHGALVPGRALSYRPGPDGTFRHAVSNLTALGSSSLFTTIEDMARWIANLQSSSPVVGTPAVIARLHERGRLNSGEAIAYAFGQSVGEYRGRVVVNHTGSWAGYRSVLERFPDDGFAVAILGNVTNIAAAALARQIADIYLADRLAPRPASAGPSAPASAADAPGWSPTAADLQAYVGTYRSAELATEYVIAVAGDELVATHFRLGDIRLRPVERDRFQAATLNDVRFLRDATGVVTGFTANTDRIRGLRFERLAR